MGGGFGFLPTLKGGMMDTTYSDEMSKLDMMNQGSGGLSLPYSEHTDHKLVILYTHLNKRIGPMTSSNAKQTMMNWNRAGIELFVNTPRTIEQIAEYKKTDKYKMLHEKWKKQRQARQRQSKKQTPEDMAKMIASETGRAVASEMNKAKRGKKNVAS